MSARYVDAILKETSEAAILCDCSEENACTAEATARFVHIAEGCGWGVCLCDDHVYELLANALANVIFNPGGLACKVCGEPLLDATQFDVLPLTGHTA